MTVESWLALVFRSVIVPSNLERLGHLNIPRLVKDIDRMKTPHGENGMTSGPIKL